MFVEPLLTKMTRHRISRCSSEELKDANNNSPKSYRLLVSTDNSMASLSWKSAGHINYCSRRYRMGRFLKVILYSLFVLIYVVVPLFYSRCTWVRRNIIYLNAFNSVPPGNLSDPVSAGGFKCARNFYLEPERGIRLGTWHVMPNSLVPDKCSPLGVIRDVGVKEFDDGRPVIVHLHGSGGTRGSTGRIRVVNHFTSPPIDAHVLTIDYRGFGDSSDVKPTVERVTNDVRALYQWLRVVKRVDNKRVIFYGQSLGTGISVHLALDAQEKEVRLENGTWSKLGGPAGLILESPYTDIAEASSQHPYTTLHTYIPFFNKFFVDPIRHPDTFWDSQTRIGNISAPVLILHAEDDVTIPYGIGKKLYEVALANRDYKRQPTRMVTYESSLGYGHDFISTDPEWPNVVANFVQEFARMR